ncbi:hypothetical protein GCM10028816_36120 [Spirosoma lituiforme]
MLGQWKLVSVTGLDRYPYNSTYYQNASGCSLANVWIYVHSNGNGGGNISMANMTPTCSPSFMAMYYDTDAGGLMFETTALNDNISWGENNGVGGDNIYVQRSNGSLSVSRGYFVSFANNGNTMIWNGPNNRIVTFERNNNGGPF